MTSKQGVRLCFALILLGLPLWGAARAADSPAKPAVGPAPPAGTAAKPADTSPKPADTPVKPPAYKVSDLITWQDTTLSDADRALVERVVTRLLAVIPPAPPAEGWAWPPKFVIDSSPVLNAFASLQRVPGQKPQPMITIHRGWMDKMVQGVEPRLAEVLGHEMGHILLRHVESPPVGTPVILNTLQREREFAADAKGMELPLKAGYAYADIIDAFKWDYQGSDVIYEGFEALAYDHPSDAERVANVAKDDVQKKLWRSTAAFEEGVFFLASEQYALAERCFRQVTTDFPSCYEGWANLGYARLMTYCDGLTPENLATKGIGQIVVGGFYRRAGALPFRGEDADLWFNAVGALRQAIQIKPDAILPKANLAVAYLLRPAPAGKDVGGATELFDQVVKALSADHSAEPLDPLTTASLLVNVGVAEQSAGHADLSQKFFDQAIAALKTVGAKKPAPAGIDAGAQVAVSVAAESSVAVSQAIVYNRAFVMAASSEESSRRSAVKELEGYLRSGNPAETWWTLAYNRYAALCTQLGQAPLSQDALGAQRSAPLRLVTELPLSGGVTIHLTDSLSDVIRQLGAGAAIPVVRNTDVQRISYPDRGFDLLATDQILAIQVYGANAPVVPVRIQGIGGKTSQLRLGMTEKELNDLLESEASFEDPRPFTNPSAVYRFYRRLGVGVLVDGATVSGLLIARLPANATNMFQPSRAAVPSPEPKRPTLE